MAIKTVAAINGTTRRRFEVSNVGAYEYELVLPRGFIPRPRRGIPGQWKCVNTQAFTGVTIWRNC